jgi:hypothetical protein
MTEKQLLLTLAAMTEQYERQMTTQALELLLFDLSPYPVPAVLKALQRCRKELSKFPTVKEIIARIDDGRPGVEEAWAMVPKDEATSCVWTFEMAQAYSACASLIDSDRIGARMAFKEKYEELVNEARSTGKRAAWSISIGSDKVQRERVVIEAVNKGRIEPLEALRLLPELQFSENFLRIAHHEVQELPRPDEKQLEGARDLVPSNLKGEK